MSAPDARDAGPRRAVSIAVFGLLIACAVLALVLLLVPKQRIAATNNATVAAFSVEHHQPKDGAICLSHQYVPGTTGGVRVLAGTYFASDASLRVRIYDGEKLASSGSIVVRNDAGETTVPIIPLASTVRDAKVCFTSDAELALAGNPAGGALPGQYTIGGKQYGSTIHVDYMHEGKQSLAQMLPTIFARASLWAPGWVGPWVFWLFLGLLPLVAGFACWQLARLLRGDVSAAGNRWLWLALGVAAINAFAWSFFAPQLMAPDEVGHYAYAETLVQNHDLPSRTPGVGGYGAYGNHEALAVDTAIRGVLGNTNGRMAWDKGTYEAWDSQDAALPDLGREQGGGWTSAAGYSPLYYIGAAVPYSIAKGSTIWTQAWVMRLYSLLWTLLTVFFCFKLARELLPTVDWAAPVAALVAAFQPMLMHIGSTINNDSMLIALVTGMFWVMTRILRRGLSWGHAAALGAFLGFGMLAKPTMLALFPLAALVLAYALFAGRGDSALPTWPKRLLASVGAGALCLLILLPYYKSGASTGDSAGIAGAITNGGGEHASLGRFFDYMWQWYFPQLPGQEFVVTTESLPVLSVFLRGFLANFNSLDTYFADGWYAPATIVLLMLLGGLAAWGVRERARWRNWWPQAAMCVLAVGSLMFVVNFRSWQQILYDGQPFAQGRYLLPLVGMFAAGIVAGSQGYKRWAPALAAFAVTGLAMMNLFGYALTLTRYFV